MYVGARASFFFFHASSRQDYVNNVDEKQQRKGGTQDRYVKQQEIKAEVGIAKVRQEALAKDTAAASAKTNAYYGGTSERQGGVTTHNIDKVQNQSREAAQGARANAEFGWTAQAKGAKKGPPPKGAGGAAAPPKKVSPAAAPAPAPAAAAPAPAASVRERGWIAVVVPPH